MGILNPLIAILVVNPLLTIGYFSRLLNKYGKGKSLFYMALDIGLPLIGFCFYLALKLFTRQNYFSLENSEDIYELPLGEEDYTDYIQEKLTDVRRKRVERWDSKLKGSFNIEPYIDILMGNNTELKLNAIQKLSTLKTKESVRLLKMALNDDSYEVRYSANSALESVAQSMMEDVELSTSHEEGDKDHFQFYLGRGKLCYELVRLELLDELTNDFFKTKALEDFLHAHSLKPENEYLSLKITEVYNSKRQYSELIEFTGSLLESSLPEETKVKIASYRAEAFFHLKRFAEVKEASLGVASSEFDIARIVEPAKYWSQNEQI